jgi:hypothetical protein
VTNETNGSNNESSQSKNESKKNDEKLPGKVLGIIGGTAGDVAGKIGETAGDVAGKAAEILHLDDKNKAKALPDPNEDKLSKEGQAFVAWLRGKNKGGVSVELPDIDGDGTTDFAVVRLRESGFLAHNYLFGFVTQPTNAVTDWLIRRVNANEKEKYAGIAVVAEEWSPTRYGLDKEIGVFVLRDRVRLGKDSAAENYVSDWLAEYTRTPKFEKKDLQDDRAEQEARKTGRTPLFIGREREMETVGHSITATGDYGTHLPWIFSIWGEGGNGKSYFLDTLRQRYAPRMAFANVDHQIVEGDEDGLLGLITEIARDLKDNGCPTPNFEKVNKDYRSAQNRANQSERNTTEIAKNVKDTLGSDEAKKIAGFAGKLKPLGFLKNVPGILNIGGTIVEVGFGIYDRVSQEQQAKNDAVIKSRPVQVYTEALVRDIEHFTKEQRKKYYLTRRPVIVFDTYELIGSLADEWLRACFLKQPGIQSVEPLILIVGRYELMRFNSRWSEYQSALRTIRLAGFDRENSLRYLKALGVDDPAQAAELYELTQGSPLFLSLAANLGSRERAIKVLAERILEEIEPQWRTLFIEIAIPETFNLETVERVLGGRGDTQAAYQRLALATFVEPNGNQLRYQSGVRSVLRRYAELENAPRFAELSRLLS